MPRLVPQSEKARATLDSQPKDMKRTVIHQILERDVAGWTNRAIADDLNLSEARISIVKGCPAYAGLKSDRLNAVEEKVTEKLSDHIVDAEGILKEAKSKAAHVMIELLENGKSEAVRASVAEKIMDRGLSTKGGVNVVVQINEKLSERFDKVLKYNE